jgi:7-cyano-7-deazaguanine synthase in queuosine biosynthesis
MKILAASLQKDLKLKGFELKVKLFGKSIPSHGYLGENIPKQIFGKKLLPAPRAWDLMSIALAVIAADLRGHRKKSSDGWTREFDLTIAVQDPKFWTSQKVLLEKQLCFLTTDVWTLEFIKGGFKYAAPEKNKIVFPKNDCVVLLSGGLDSLAGIIDNVNEKHRPFAVSQLVQGDAEFQREIVQKLSNVEQIQFNHNATIPHGETPSSQRSRSILFISYAVLVATTLLDYQKGSIIPIYVYENGFISLNPPLTGARLGSLSTRTTNPQYIKLFQELLTAAGLKVRLLTPYQFKTKGELLKECKDQNLLSMLASKSISCGRYRIFGFTHCGRCIPCLVRRAAFLHSGLTDKTVYKFKHLGKRDKAHRKFDDVWSASMGIFAAKADGVDTWLSATLNSSILGNVKPYQDTIEKGLLELEKLLKKYKVI